MRNSIQYDQVVQLALRLTPIERARLVERLEETLEKDLEGAQQPPKSLFGALAHLGNAPSSEEIDAVRKEVWGNFPRQDVHE